MNHSTDIAAKGLTINEYTDTTTIIRAANIATMR
jgi:hypothetical protein